MFLNLATLFNTATGMVAVVPITTARNNLSGFEIPMQAGRVRGVALLSGCAALIMHHATFSSRPMLPLQSLPRPIDGCI